MATYDELPYAERCAVRRKEADRRARERRWALHINGVHVECRAGSSKFASDIDRCPRAGRVERFHSHNFDGLLVCGCDDFGS